MSFETFIESIEKSEYEQVTSLYRNEYLEMDKEVEMSDLGFYLYVENAMKPIHFDARTDNLDVIGFLISNGADLESKDDCDYTPILHACDRGELDVVKYLVDKGCNLHVTNRGGRNTIHFAAYRGNLELLTYLVKMGCDLDMLDGTETTPLHYACSKGFFDIVQCLVENGCDIDADSSFYGMPLVCVFNYCENNGNTPAIKKNTLDIVKYLIEKGCNIDPQDDDGDKTLLNTACEFGSVSVVQCMIERGAHVDVNDKRVMQCACRSGNLDLVLYLLTIEFEIDVNDELVAIVARNDRRTDNLDLLYFLVERGCNIEVEDMDGYRAIHRAVHRSCDHVAINYLIDKGCDIEAESKRGHRPIKFARDITTVKCLIERGCEINSMTIINEMSMHADTEVIMHLLSINCNIALCKDENNSNSTALNVMKLREAHIYRSLNTKLKRVIYRECEQELTCNHCLIGPIECVLICGHLSCVNCTDILCECSMCQCRMEIQLKLIW